MKPFHRVNALAVLLSLLVWNIVGNGGAVDIAIAENPTAAPSANHFKITWPKGWSLKDLPGARGPDGRDLGGQRIQASLVSPESPKNGSAIDFNIVPIAAGASPDLDRDFQQMKDAMSKLYEQKGAKMFASDTKVVTLGGLAARSASIELKQGDAVVLRQWFSAAYGKKHFYSIGFSTTELDYVKLTAIWEDVKNSLVLE